MIEKLITKLTTATATGLNNWCYAQLCGFKQPHGKGYPKTGRRASSRNSA